MTTTVNLRKTLHRRQWEAIAPMPSASPISTVSMIAKSQLADQLVFGMNASTIVTHFYRPDEDAWLGNTVAFPVGVSTGAFACHHPNGPTGTATAGTTTTITTATTVAVTLANYVIRITGGTGAGQERAISSNTIGANSVITVASNWTTPPDGTSTYLLLTGRFWFYAGSSNGFRYYDVATSTFSAALTLPTSTWTNDTCLVSTPGYYGSALPGGTYGQGIASGTATAGAANTLTNGGKAWATNQWANFQVRIVSGTGAGQVRTIASNTGTVLTVSANWTANPDTTSNYVIEGNDDFLYLSGGNTTALQRYSISGNSWAAMTARSNGTGTGNGSCSCWMNASTDPLFTQENAIVNGRRLYSLSNNATNPLDYYDIPSNTWTNAVPVGRLAAQSGLNQSGSCGILIGDNWYIAAGGTPASSVTSGHVWRLNLSRQTLDPWSQLLYPGVGNIMGQRMFDAWYVDGGTIIRWIYMSPVGTPFWARAIIL